MFIYRVKISAYFSSSEVSSYSRGVLSLSLTWVFHGPTGNFCELLQLRARCEVDRLPGGARCREALLGPVVKVTDVVVTLNIGLNGVIVPRLDQEPLPLLHGVHQLEVLFLFEENVMLPLVLQTFRPLLCLLHVVLSELPLLLLEHHLVVTLADEFLNLLPTPVKFLHDLCVSLLRSPVTICLSRAHVSEVLPLDILVLLKLLHVIVIDALELVMSLIIFDLSIFLHFAFSFMLHGPELDQILLDPTVFISQIYHLTIVH